MINRTQADRIAASVHAIRPDWPIRSLITMISQSLADWSFLDAAVGLVYVAADPASRTPARVLEPGPWRTVGIANAELEAIRERDRHARAERERARDQRRLAILACQHCDDRGKVDGHPCSHQPELAEIARRGAAVARDEVRRPPEPTSDGTAPTPLRSRAWGPIGIGRPAPTKEPQRVAVLEREDFR